MTSGRELSDLIAALNDALNATNSLHRIAERWLFHEALPQIHRTHSYDGGEAAKTAAAAFQTAPDVSAALARAIEYLRTTPSQPST
jgi:hypothetical protein